MASRLSPLQHEVLRAFFARERGFFLTGGAALAGFHLGHRATEDLDLFTANPTALEAGERALLAVAAELGARLEAIQTAPDFRRRLLTRGQEGLRIDLVLDRVPQASDTKVEIDGVVVDPPLEILVNKLCALLSRAEIRDLVDVRALEASGLDLAAALPLAAAKDGGLTPAQLAWVLSTITIGDGAELPGGVTPDALRAYLRDLERRLARMAFPGQGNRI